MYGLVNPLAIPSTKWKDNVKMDLGERDNRNIERLMDERSQRKVLVLALTLGPFSREYNFVRRRAIFPWIIFK